MMTTAALDSGLCERKIATFCKYASSKRVKAFIAEVSAMTGLPITASEGPCLIRSTKSGPRGNNTIIHWRLAIDFHCWLGVQLWTAAEEAAGVLEAERAEAGSEEADLGASDPVDEPTRPGFSEAGLATSETVEETVSSGLDDIIEPEVPISQRPVPMQSAGSSSFIIGEDVDSSDDDNDDHILSNGLISRQNPSGRGMSDADVPVVRSGPAIESDEDREADLYIRHFKSVVDNVADGYVNLTGLLDAIRNVTGRTINMWSFRRDCSADLDNAAQVLGGIVKFEGDVSVCKNTLSRFRVRWISSHAVAENEVARIERVHEDEVDFADQSDTAREGAPALIYTYSGVRSPLHPFAIHRSIVHFLLEYAIPQFRNGALASRIAILDGDLGVAAQVVRNHDRANGTQSSVFIDTRPADPEPESPSTSHKTPLHAARCSVPAFRRFAPPKQKASRSSVQLDSAVVVRGLEALAASHASNHRAQELMIADRHILSETMTCLAAERQRTDDERRRADVERVALDAERKRTDDERVAAAEKHERLIATAAERQLQLMAEAAAESKRQQAIADELRERAHQAEMERLRLQHQLESSASSVSSTSSNPTSSPVRLHYSDLAESRIRRFYHRKHTSSGRTLGDRRSSIVDLSAPSWLYLAEVIPHDSLVVVATKIGISADLYARVFQNVKDHRYTLFAWHLDIGITSAKKIESEVIRANERHRCHASAGRESIALSIGDLADQVERVLRGNGIRAQRINVPDAFSS